jgi:hypothetical protein
MMHKKDPLAVVSYRLLITNSLCTVTIAGFKQPPPSKRITLSQRGLNITKAKIVLLHKKGDQHFDIKRINHIKSFEEVRVHTEQTIYPGNLEISLNFKSNNLSQLDVLDKLGAWENMSWRSVFPCLDTPEARKLAKVEVVKEA